ncbi:unnamed protein product [Rotaria socialis]
MTFFFILNACIDVISEYNVAVVNSLSTYCGVTWYWKMETSNILSQQKARHGIDAAIQQQLTKKDIIRFF